MFIASVFKSVDYGLSGADFTKEGGMVLNMLI